MKTLAIFILTSALLFFSGAESSTFTISNNCSYTVWPATLTGAGTPQLSSTGFELASKANQTLTITAPWSGRVWGRTGCTTDPSGKFTCVTADCASGKVECLGAGGIPPASLVEFTLAPDNGMDFYDVSLVDGFNLPVSIASQGAVECPSTSCPGDINSVCPPELAVKGSDGSVVACKSACEVFHEPQYCCTGAYASPTTCPPTNYSQIFKAQCPQAYSYAYDDATSTFTCTGGPDYVITFCP